MPSTRTSLAASTAIIFLATTVAAQCGSSKTACTSTKGKDIVQTAMAAGSFQTLASALQAADLVDTLKGKGPFTVFAPTDAAFARLPDGTVSALLQPAARERLTQILTYHVAGKRLDARHVLGMKEVETLAGMHLSVRKKGSSVYVGDALVTKTDIECTNGVIHVIDTVLLPEAPEQTAAGAPVEQMLSILETAQSNDDFSTLVAAVKAAGLVDALSADGPFTVFAPTNAAFAALPEGVLASLLEPANRRTLQDILKFHVASGKIGSNVVKNNTVTTTLLGKELRFAVKKKGVFANDARIVTTDIACSNGVIHVIDSVMIPPQKIAQVFFPKAGGTNLENVDYSLPGLDAPKSQRFARR